MHSSKHALHITSSLPEATLFLLPVFICDALPALPVFALSVKLPAFIRDAEGAPSLSFPCHALAEASCGFTRWLYYSVHLCALSFFPPPFHRRLFLGGGLCMRAPSLGTSCCIGL